MIVQKDWHQERPGKGPKFAPPELLESPTHNAETETWMLLEYCDKGTLQVRTVPAQVCLHRQAVLRSWQAPAPQACVVCPRLQGLAETLPGFP